MEHLEPTVIEKYGGKAWLKQHNTIQRLNMQAHINAVMRGDEYVMESMSTFDKVGYPSYFSLETNPVD